MSEAGFEQTRKRYDPRAGDVIVTCVGTIGEVAVVPVGLVFSADRNLAAIRPEKTMNSNLLAHLLMSPQVQRQFSRASGSTAQPHLYLRDLRGIEIPHIPLHEQEQLVAEIEAQLSLIDSQSRAIDQALKRANALRRSILERAFSGRLVPQDPSDEPASVLLERIRTEHPAEKKSRKAAKSAG